MDLVLDASNYSVVPNIKHYPTIVNFLLQERMREEQNKKKKHLKAGKNCR